MAQNLIVNGVDVGAYRVTNLQDRGLGPDGPRYAGALTHAGVRVATFQNDGHGAGVLFTFCDAPRDAAGYTPAERAFYAHAAAQPPVLAEVAPGVRVPVPVDADGLVALLCDYAAAGKGGAR